MPESKTDAEAMLLIHKLLSSHPNKELVNDVHLAMLGSSFSKEYFDGAWRSFGARKSKS